MTQQDASRSLYDRSVVIDALNISNWDSANVYDSLHNGGVTAINATIAVWENYRECMDNLVGWLHRFERDDRLVQATSVRDILSAKEEGKVGVVLGWQNASPIENDLNRLAMFYALGVRVIQFTYNERNLLGNGCYERSDDGLSHFGVDAVKEINRLGILIDLSHVGDRTTTGGCRSLGASCGGYSCQRPQFLRSCSQQDGRCVEADCRKRRGDRGQCLPAVHAQRVPVDAG